VLGEGPLWHEERNSFFWVDIEGKFLNEWQQETCRVSCWRMPQRIGMAAQVNDHLFIIALQDGLASFDLRNGAVKWLKDLEKDIASNRPNDGKCDVAGRLWLGTMDVDCSEDSGALYCIDQNFQVQKKLGGLTISNGMAWTKHNDRMYFIDSATRRIDSFLFDPETGNIIFERTAINVPENMGSPDGMTIDEEEMLWVAHWDGFAVNRWNPITGELLATIEVPVPQVSSCTFGGPQLDKLFITTAKTGMTEEMLKKYPMSGDVFVAEPGVRGRRAFRFRLPEATV